MDYSFVPELRGRLLDRRAELQDELASVDGALGHLDESKRAPRRRASVSDEEALAHAAVEAEEGFDLSRGEPVGRAAFEESRGEPRQLGDDAMQGSGPYGF